MKNITQKNGNSGSLNAWGIPRTGKDLNFIGLSSRLAGIRQRAGLPAQLFPVFLTVVCLLSIRVQAATWYVDGSVATSGNGTSWATAWMRLSNISSTVAAGDTVYISGGPSGSSLTYSIGAIWTPKGGTAGNPITYQIGQDASHNGKAIFSGTAGFLNTTVQNVTISGDAGDGARHFQTSGLTYIIYNASGAQNGVRLSYINFGNISGAGGAVRVISFLNVNKFQFDHNYVYCTGNNNIDAFGYFSFQGSTWDDNKINDNTIYVPRHVQVGGLGSPVGADIIQTGGSIGYSIYNNRLLTWISSTYSGSQHQDGIQDTGGSSYIKIYNNTFNNIAENAVYIDAAFAGFNNVYVYNNIALFNDTYLQHDSAESAAVLVQSYGNFAMNNIVVMNNIADGYGPSGVSVPFSSNIASGSPTFSGDVFANNIYVNGNSPQWGITSTVADNVGLTSAQAQSAFTSYTANSGVDSNGNPLNNYHLISTATSLIGQGMNEISYSSTDRDGNARPASGAWDVGPYLYIPPCTPAPAGLVSWWIGEGNSLDRVGGNNGTAQDVTFATGEVGQAFVFNGSSSDVQVPASTSLDVGTGDGFTLEAWINPANVSQRGTLFEWNTGDGTTYWGVHFYIDPYTANGFEPGALYANVVDNSGGWHQVFSPGGAVTVNVFQHVALTYDKASGIATIYCNGVVVAQQNIGTFTPLTSYDLYLGKRPMTQGETYFFAGLLDEASLYSRALSASEIQSIYNAGSAGKCPP